MLQRWSYFSQHCLGKWCSCLLIIWSFSSKSTIINLLGNGMSDEEAFILADYLLIISCGVHAVAAIISCGVLTAYYNQGSLSINWSLAWCDGRVIYGIVVVTSSDEANVSVNTILWSRVGFAIISIDSLLSSVLIGHQLVFCLLRWKCDLWLHCRTSQCMAN